MHNTRLCIFDLDGTLIDTVGTIAHYVNSSLAHFGLGTIETDRFKLLAGDGAAVLIERAIELVGGDMKQKSDILAHYMSAYNREFLYKTVVYDDIKELLMLLKAKSIKIAVLTNKPHDTTIKVLDTLFDKDTFDTYLGASDSLPLKPNPDGAYRLINALGINKSETLYIGDTLTDMRTGKAAGLYTVGVLWGFRNRQELEYGKADVIISKPLELLDCLNK